MARNRTIYSNEILMVAPSATGSQYLNDGGAGESLIRQVKRVQNVNYGFSINRTDTYQFGQLARIDSAVLSAPTVSLDFSYYLTDGQNENLLGFDNAENSNFLSESFINDQDGRNFYIYTADQKNDAIGSISDLEAQSDDNKSVIGIGNCYVTNYSVNASVGGLPIASVSAEAFNIKVDAGNKAGDSPGINIKDGTKSTETYVIPNEYISTGDGVAQLLPGDIEVDFGTGALLSLISDSAGANSAHIQSFSIDVPLGRTTLQRIGNSFGYSKVLDTPITASVSISAILADRPDETRSLFEEVYANNKNDIKITMHKPSSAGAKQGDKSIVYILKNATLESESYGMSIGDNRSADYTFTAQLGDPKNVADGSLGGSFTMNSSGNYEQLQVIETGMSTDTKTDQGYGIFSFGSAVAANDDFLVIGASGFIGGGDSFENGAAYIYKKEKGFYKQIHQTSGEAGIRQAGLSNTAKLPDDSRHHNFGGAVAVSPSGLIAIATPDAAGDDGSVSIFEPNDGKNSFTINTVLTDATNNIRYSDDIAFDKSVSGDGQQLGVIGAPHQTVGSTGNHGAIYIFKGTVTNGYKTSAVNAFSEAQIPTTSLDLAGQIFTAGQRLGHSVAMHKGVIVAGAPENNILAGTHPSGSALVYVATQGLGGGVGHYRIVANLTGTKYGSTEGVTQNSAFGTDVDIFENTIVVGAPSGNHNGTSNAGAVFVFTGFNDAASDAKNYKSKPTRWKYAATLSQTAAAANDLFGYTVSMPTAHKIVVGAPGRGDANKGAAYVFTGEGASWTQTQEIQYSGVGGTDKHGRPETALATTEKEIFIGGAGNVVSEEVIRYRI